MNDKRNIMVNRDNRVKKKIRVEMYQNIIKLKLYWLMTHDKIITNDSDDLYLCTYVDGNFIRKTDCFVI